MHYLLAFNIGNEFSLRDRTINQVFNTPGSLFSVILANVYIIAGIILFVLLLFGGVSLIIGAGSHESGKMQNGQKAITAALAGFAVIFLSYFIIQFIQTITGVQILNPNL